jgi:tetratricopeptide (TPR) repeat protein
MWWTFPDSFAGGGVYTALGVGSQTITVVPAHDIVFIHRVDTYVGDRVSLTNITGLLQRLIEARTGDTEDEPLFVPLPDPPPAARFTEVDEETLAEYAGRYLSVNVMLEDGALVLYDPSGGSFGMLPITEREFLLEDIQDRVYFRSTEEGEYQLILQSMQDRRARAQIRSGNVQRAIEILVQNVEYFPDSWKAYDSLAGAYEHAGDSIHAIENFRRSLVLNPRNANAAEAIERLGGNSP